MKINNQSRFRQDWFRFESVRGPRYEARGTRASRITQQVEYGVWLLSNAMVSQVRILVRELIKK